MRESFLYRASHVVGSLAVLAFVFVSVVAATRIAGDSSFREVRSQRSITLFNDVLASADSMTAGNSINLGAYDLIAPSGMPVRGFRIFARPGCVVTGDSVWLRFQRLRDSTVTDTVSWQDSLRLSVSGNRSSYYAVGDSGYTAVVFSAINYAGVSRAIKKSVFVQLVDF